MFLVLILQYGGTSVHRILSLSLLSFLFYEECAYLIFVISLNFCVKYVYMSKKLFLINAVFLVLILQYGGKHMHRILSLFYFLLNEECFPFFCVFFSYFLLSMSKICFWIHQCFWCWSCNMGAQSCTEYSPFPLCKRRKTTKEILVLNPFWGKHYVILRVDLKVTVFQFNCNISLGKQRGRSFYLLHLIKQSIALK